MMGAARDDRSKWRTPTTTVATRNDGSKDLSQGGGNDLRDGIGLVCEDTTDTVNVLLSSFFPNKNC
jgi:hypothetical protein